MIGIYKYTNKYNGHCYIGQSIDLEKRKLSHKSSVANKKAKDYNSQFHKAVRKYGGFESFDYEILVVLSDQEYSKEKLNFLEKFYIQYYNSYQNGYNATPGGTGLGKNGNVGSKNGRALLTEEEVRYIRECYNNHIPFREIYKEFKNKIMKRGLQKVWNFENWKDICAEYYTEQNRYWHSHQAKANSSEVASNNKRAFSEKQVKQMRIDYYNNNLSVKEIQNKYAPNKAYSTVKNAITGKTYKDIK